MTDVSATSPDAETPTAVTNQGWWAPVPEELILDPDVSHLALRVWCILRRHGDSPDNCYPSHRRIAGLLGVSPRSIARPLKDLETAGWIERFERRDGGGSRLADGYVVLTSRVDADATPNDEGRANERTPHANERGGPTQTSAYPPRKPARYIEEEPEPYNQSQGKRKPRERATQRAMSNALALPDEPKQASTYPPDFVAFWAEYPRRSGKGAAAKAWKAATKRASVEAIMDGLRAHLPAFSQTEDKWIPMPATWLNQNRWEDDPPPRPRIASARPNRVDENMAKIHRSLQRMGAS